MHGILSKLKTKLRTIEKDIFQLPVQKSIVNKQNAENGGNQFPLAQKKR